MIRNTTIAALVASAAGVAALAHGGATGIVKERMDAMSAMGDATKAVAPMMRGEAPYDADALRQAAESFRSHAGEAMTSLFPEGSGGAPSEARDEIWENWDAFAALAEQLDTYAEGLALAAGNGMAAGSEQMSADSMMGGDDMMGGDMMGGEAMMTAADIGAMPADAAFAMVSQVCSTCHTRFRKEAR